MSGFTDAKRRLSGSFGTLQVDGADWGEVAAVSIRIEAETQDVRRGLDVDKKIVGRIGRGTIRIVRAFTRSEAMVNAIKSGKMPAFRLVAALCDPDAQGAGEERVAIDNVKFYDIDVLSFAHGEISESEYPFFFAPGDLRYLDTIKA